MRNFCGKPRTSLNFNCNLYSDTKPNRNPKTATNPSSNLTLNLIPALNADPRRDFPVSVESSFMESFPRISGF